MSKLFIGVLLAFGIFACYHYWPESTVKAGHKIADTTKAAAKAGYNEATGNHEGATARK
jgi:hypothetical protein